LYLQEKCGIDSTGMYNQRLNYIHWNPVSAGLSSRALALDISVRLIIVRRQKGLLDLIILDGF